MKAVLYLPFFEYIIFYRQFEIFCNSAAFSSLFERLLEINTKMFSYNAIKKVSKFRKRLQKKDNSNY